VPPPTTLPHAPKEERKIKTIKINEEKWKKSVNNRKY
jgi:hypothetical protein